MVYYCILTYLLGRFVILLVTLIMSATGPWKHVGDESYVISTFCLSAFVGLVRWFEISLYCTIRHLPSFMLTWQIGAASTCPHIKPSLFLHRTVRPSKLR